VKSNIFTSAVEHYLSIHGFGQFEPKAVLFDMDGVLYNSMPNHAKAWQESMAIFGIHMTEADAYATEGARGIDTIRTMVRQQQGRDISLDEAQTMYDEKTRIFHSMAEAQIMPGILEVMNTLKQRGWTIGVVTGSGQRPLINRLLTDFADYLDQKHIVTAYDVKRGKPAPDPYLMGLKKVGELAPWEAIVVENAPLGVRAGVAAHIFTIAVNTGPLPDSALLQEGADLLFNDMWELQRLMQF
jgi:HAD superfamily hydrolase (TIGR01509 family)